MAKATPIRGLSARTTLRAAGPRVLAARLRDVERHEVGLPGADPVHDMRVATRRLRAALRLLCLRELDAPVKRLQDALGEVRDLQLQIEWFTGRDERMAARRKVRLPGAQAALGNELSRWRSRTLPLLLQAVEGKFKGKLAGKKTRRMLDKRLSVFEERLEAALERPTPAAMHAVRRSVKQLRYLFELVLPSFPALSKSLLADLTPLQESLGELHDTDVRVALIKSGPLLREQREDRERLAAIVTAELSRWKKQRIAPKARRALA